MAITRISQSSVKEGLEKFNNFYAGLTGAFLGDYDSIQTVTVGAGGQSSIIFSSIPQIYQHLQIRLIARTSRTGPGEDALGIRLNNDTGATKYAFHVLLGNGSTASGSPASSTNLMVGVNASSNSATANVFGCAIINILDYTNTSKTKVMQSLTGFETNTEGKIEIRSGLWNDTSAVNAITMTSTISSNILQYSTAALYGIKAP